MLHNPELFRLKLIRLKAVSAIVKAVSAVSAASAEDDMNHVIIEKLFSASGCVTEATAEKTTKAIERRCSCRNM